MHTIDTQTIFILTVGCSPCIDCTCGMVHYKKEQSRRLQERFGPEIRADPSMISEAERKAESELKGAKSASSTSTIVPLTPSEAARFIRPGKICRALRR